MLRINDIYDFTVIKPTRAELKSRVIKLLSVPKLALIVGQGSHQSQVRHKCKQQRTQNSIRKSYISGLTSKFLILY